MRAIPGYLDITPGDFKEVYRLAFAHALERLRRAITAAEIMTTDVVAVKGDTPVAEVAAAMGSRGVSGVPVVDADNKVMGVISEQDFLSRMGVQAPRNFMSLVAGCLKTKGCVALPIQYALAKDIMTSPAVTVAPDLPVRDLAMLLTQKSINRVIVTDPAGHLLGLVSRGGHRHGHHGWGGAMIGAYFRKMAGVTQAPPRVGLVEILWSWLGAFLGIGAVAYVNYGWLDQTGLIMLIGSFGASAVSFTGPLRAPWPSLAISWAGTSFRPSSGSPPSNC